MFGFVADGKNSVLRVRFEIVKSNALRMKDEGVKNSVLWVRDVLRVQFEDGKNSVLRLKVDALEALSHVAGGDVRYP